MCCHIVSENVAVEKGFGNRYSNFRRMTYSNLRVIHKKMTAYSNLSFVLYTKR